MLAEVGVTVLGEADQWDRGLLNDRRPRLDSSSRTCPTPDPSWLRQWSQETPGHRAAMARPHDPSRRLLARLPAHSGRRVRLDNGGLHVTGHGFDGSDSSDVNLRAVGGSTPTIAALAACTDRASYAASDLRGHETDRITAIATRTPARRVAVDDRRRP